MQELQLQSHTHTQITVRIKHICWCIRPWGLAVLPRMMDVFSITLPSGEDEKYLPLAALRLHRPSRRAEQPERVFTSPATSSAFLSSLLPFLAQRSQAAILWVLHWLRKACSTKTKGMDFCFPGHSVLLPQCTWNGCYSKRHLCYLALRWCDFNCFTSVSLLRRCF